MDTSFKKAATQVNERVKNLKEKMLCNPGLSIERAYLMTQSYKETESYPATIRRARALEKILSEMSIDIEDGELIVGKLVDKKRAAMMTPEINCELYKEIASSSDEDWPGGTPITEAEKEKLNQFLPYWSGKTLYDKWLAIAIEEGNQFQYKTHMPAPHPFNNIHLGHCSPGYNKVLTKGLIGIKKEVDTSISKLNLAENTEDYQKLLFLNAVSITLEATISLAHRYAALAVEKLAEEPNNKKKSELSRIAEICTWVPANPARNLHEALQSMWFTYIALIVEGWSPGIGFGRADQYLYPFYRRDIENGTLTGEQARELLALFYIKLNELAGPLYGFSRTLPGYAMLSNFTIGGITEDGRDAVNELSYLFLDAETDVGLHSEEIVIRVNKNNPDSFLIKACEVAKLMRGKLKFVGDETAMQQLLSDGKPLNYVRDYAVVGCLIPTIPARSFESAVAEFLNLPLMLEIALNNGVSRLTGEQMGPRTGNPREFKSYEELWDAYKKQVGYLICRRIPDRNASRALYAEFLPTPFQSCLFEGCIEKGTDITNGGTAPYITQAWSVCGAPDVGDSLAAIKKAVFEDKKISMDQLIDALDKNFEGEEEILHILRSVPKFGNDIDYVDLIVKDVFAHASREVSKYKGFAGAVSNLQAGAVATNLLFGKAVGALPDGRKAGEALAEGGVSPHQGRNVNGPTATLRSVAKIDHVKLTGGTVLNMRFNPDALKDVSNLKRFASLIRTFFETGGFLVQFNIVSGDTLRNAQQHPDRYRDLLVRIATYSAYFVDLPLELQNDIIARIEFQQM